MATNTSLTASAELKLSPQGSQTVLTALGVLAAFSLAIASFLIYVDRFIGGAALLTFSVASAVGMVWCWSRSQRDVDLRGSVPTSVRLADGTAVVTDSRLLSTVDGMRSFSALLDTVATRQPLPPPTGLTSPTGELIEGSADEAQARVVAINSELATVTDQALDTIRAALGGHGIAQRPVEKSMTMLSPARTSPTGTNAVAL